MKEGWVCPKCGKVYAPWIPSCDCYKQKQNKQTICPNTVLQQWSFPEEYKPNENES